MKYFDWDNDKNEWLKRARKVSFEDALALIESGEVLDVLEHPNQQRYPQQKMFVLNIHGYVYIVPFIEDGENIFLKTIFPSRKLMKKYYSRVNV